MTNKTNELAAGGYTITASRMEEDRSRGFRWLLREDGSKVLQIACPWSSGVLCGVEWKDIPEVKENNHEQ